MRSPYRASPCDPANQVIAGAPWGAAALACAACAGGIGGLVWLSDVLRLPAIIAVLGTVALALGLPRAIHAVAMRPLAEVGPRGLRIRFGRPRAFRPWLEAVDCQVSWQDFAGTTYDANAKELRVDLRSGPGLSIPDGWLAPDGRALQARIIDAWEQLHARAQERAAAVAQELSERYAVDPIVLHRRMGWGSLVFFALFPGAMLAFIGLSGGPADVWVLWLLGAVSCVSLIGLAYAGWSGAKIRRLHLRAEGITVEPLGRTVDWHDVASVRRQVHLTPAGQRELVALEIIPRTGERLVLSGGWETDLATIAELLTGPFPGRTKTDGRAAQPIPGS